MFRHKIVMVTPPNLVRSSALSLMMQRQTCLLVKCVYKNASQKCLKVGIVETILHCVSIAAGEHLYYLIFNGVLRVPLSIQVTYIHMLKM